MEKAIQYKEKQAYMKKVDKVGEYWDNNSALRPMTKEVIDYWWNRKPGTRLKATSYLRECQGTFDTGFEYFVVQPGSKECNRCIEIYCIYNDIRGNDVFNADKRMRETTKTIKEELKKMQ